MDIVSLPIEVKDKIKGIEGRFRLVNVAALRAKELAQGGEPKVQTKSIKVTTIALEETIAGKVEFLTGEDAVKAREEAKKLDFRRLLEESSEETESEDLSELEKDLQRYFPEESDSGASDSSDDDFNTEE